MSSERQNPKNHFLVLCSKSVFGVDCHKMSRRIWILRIKIHLETCHTWQLSVSPWRHKRILWLGAVRRVDLYKHTFSLCLRLDTYSVLDVILLALAHLFMHFTLCFINRKIVLKLFGSEKVDKIRCISCDMRWKSVFGVECHKMSWRIWILRIKILLETCHTWQ